MFGKNEKVGQSYFSDLQSEQKVSITSIFATLQGEGPYSGRRAVFVRLAQCQLACSFCDTYFSKGDSMTVDEVEIKVFEQIDKFLTTEQRKHRNNLRFSPKCSWGFLQGPDPIIVFTGGEPGLQMHMLEQLISRFVSEGLTCQIESNGIIPFTDFIWDNATVVISPKCSERNGVPTKYIKPHKTNLDKTQHLKFVVTSDTSSPYSEIPEWALDEQKARAPIGLKDLTIYVSPMNIYNREPVKSSLLRENGVQSDLTTRSTVDETISFWEPGLLNQTENQKNHEHAARLCMETGAVLSLQTHLYASLP